MSVASRVWIRVGRARVVGVLLLLATVLGVGASHTAASSVDGAGRIVVVPLVLSSPKRESIVTITNAGPEPLRITSRFIGADGSPLAGDRTSCRDQRLAGSGSVTLPLKDLCDMAPDVENLGYLEMTSRDGDSRLTFFATSVLVASDYDTSAIAGQPIGAYTPAEMSASRSVLGLRTQGPGARHPEHLACYVATFDESTTVTVHLLDGSGAGLSTATLSLPARSMVRLVLGNGFSPTADRDNVSVRVQALDLATSAVGCALEDVQTGSIAYQPAQTVAPADSSRLRDVHVEWSTLYQGPYQIGGLVWDHTLLGGRADYKVVLSTYLRPNDSVRCFLEAPTYIRQTGTPAAPPSDPSPWLELQMRAPDGTVAAGGNGVKDTGVFHTGPAGRYHSSYGQRWLIDVSFDEDAHNADPWPRNYWNWGRFFPWGYWGVRCQSAAGMSQPLGVPVPFGNTDNF